MVNIPRSSRAPRRSVWFLTGTVVLPIVALAAFSLISIRSQRQNIDQELSRRAYVVNGGIQEQVDRIFQQMESALDAVAPTLAAEPRSDAGLAEGLRQYPLAGVQIRTATGILKAPAVPWNQPESFPVPGACSSNFLNAFTCAEADEIQGDWETAADDYHRLWQIASTSREKALALNAMGRTYQRLEETPNALAAYRRLLRDVPREVALNGLSLGAIAYLESVALEMQMGDFLSAVRLGTKFLQVLRTEQLPCSMDECRYDFERLAALITDSVQGRLAPNEMADFTRQALLLRNVLAAATWDDVAMRKLLQSAPAQGYSYQVLGPMIVGGGGIKRHPAERVVYLVDSTRLKTAIQTAVQQALKYAETFHYEIRDADQRVFLASPETRLAPPVARQALTARLAGWELSVSVGESATLKANARLRMLTIGGVIVLLLGVIAAGLYFMTALTRKEAELSAMKTDFVSSVSHEMRTPLTTIRMIAEMFQLDRVKDPQMGRDYIETIAGETKRLTRLINKVLDFSRLDSGRKPYTLTRQDLGPIAAAAVQMFEAGVKADGYQVKLDLQPALPPVAVDGDALTEVLLNLLDNAVKYSPVHKEIRVAVRRQEQELVIEVADQGIGIDPRKKDKIFEKFYRGEDELTRQTKGTGIGLAIVKHIVEAHHGRIEVRSTRGEGSVFTVILPV